MSRPNIKLVRVPKPDDFCRVDDASAKPCVCTEEMIAGLLVKPVSEGVPVIQMVITPWQELMCKPCAARQLLNGVASLAATLA